MKQRHKHPLIQRQRAHAHKRIKQYFANSRAKIAIIFQDIEAYEQQQNQSQTKQTASDEVIHIKFADKLIQFFYQ